MIKFLSYLFLSCAVLAGLLRFSLEFESAQDIAIEQIYRAKMSNAANGLPNPDSLRVFICGSASPVGVTGRAQACVAIITPTHFYIFNSGAGSTSNASRAGLPLSRLQGIFLTHLHANHIAEIYELNLASWGYESVTALQVYGPKGVRRVVSGINETYAQDIDYRVARHGGNLLDPKLAKLKAKAFGKRTVLEDGELTITALLANQKTASPSISYRIDYRGRSVFISGESQADRSAWITSESVDLMLLDALSLPLMKAAQKAATTAGLNWQAKILANAEQYHASTGSLVGLQKNLNAKMVALYHLVPAPENLIMSKVFERDLSDNFVFARDGAWFELPSEATSIVHTPK